MTGTGLPVSERDTKRRESDPRRVRRYRVDEQGGPTGSTPDPRDFEGLGR